MSVYARLRNVVGRLRRRLSVAHSGSASDAAVHPSERHIYVNLPLPNHAVDHHGAPLAHYTSNEVVTSKYSLLSFIPKNFFEQFRRLANQFFLLLIILQTFKDFETVDPMVAALPTVIIVLATALKDGFEDLKRHNTDNQVNSRCTNTLPRWKNVNYVDKKTQKRWAPFFWLRAALTGRQNSVAVLVTDPQPRPVPTDPTDENADGSDTESPDDPARGATPTSMTAVALDPNERRRSDGDGNDVRLPAGQYDLDDDIVSDGDVDDMGGAVEESSDDIERGHDSDPGSESGDLSSALGSNAASIAYTSQERNRRLDDEPWKPVAWRDLRVGDFVRLKNNDFIPADVAILSSSEPDGICYVETKNLDGETNLKVRRGITETAHLATIDDCRRVQLVVSAEAPSNNMFTCNGSVEIRSLGYLTEDGCTPPPVTVPITLNGVLLRGCILRNTAWAIGIVMYTGNETKLQLNSGDTPSKRSIIERKMNPQIMINLGLIAIICVACAIVNSIWAQQFRGDVPFLPVDDKGYSTAWGGFIAFWSSLIAFQNLVPISLYLTVEICKTLQAYFIYSDIQMYYDKADLPCVPKSWNLSDDLGQIEYVFSDKTGTLTQNVMVFRRCTINGVVYGAPLLKSPITAGAGPGPQFQLPDDYSPRSRYASKSPQFYDTTLHGDMNTEDSEHAILIREFWRLLGICHTVLVSKPEQDAPADQIVYKAQSPDEAALVDTARELGFAFIGRQMTNIYLDVAGVEEQYTLLAVLEFNSTRKRMSIVARRPDGAIVLYTKGADTVIFERLSPDTPKLLKDVTLAHLEIFAEEGLRTLCLAYRIIEQDEFDAWIQTYNTACTALDDRDDKIDAAAELIERDLVLLGATAIEDKLQDKVPECIQILRDAGIKLWVLTGDKMETAIAIGFSCNLLSKDLNLIVVRGDDPGSVMKQISGAYTAFFAPNSDPMAAAKTKAQLRGSDEQINPSDVLDAAKDHALIIDGAALKIALDPENKRTLLDLATKCRVVITSRVSPLQKAQVVSLVKDGCNAVTCAIGDGANDVSMIQAAHIGIGIAGEEGLQAVMASDYAIAQFQYLSRLLLVHGRWSYQRISELIYNYFYKDLIFVLVIWWYQFCTGFSTQEPYEFSYMVLYNLFFTNWPVMILGIFDQDLPDYLAIKAPKLYQSGMYQTLFTTKRFWAYMFEGLWQSLVCFFVPYAIYAPGQASHYGGTVADRLEMGTTMAAAAITSANLFVAMNTRTFTWLNHVANWALSIGVFYGYLLAFCETEGASVYGMGRILWSSPAFWLGLLLSVSLSLLPRYVATYWQRMYHPTDRDIAVEYHKFGLDLAPLLPEPVVVPEPITPPSAHPDKLMVKIPSTGSGKLKGSGGSGGSHGTGGMLEAVPTPVLVQYGAQELLKSTQVATSIPSMGASGGSGMQRSPRSRVSSQSGSSRSSFGAGSVHASGAGSDGHVRTSSGAVASGPPSRSSAAVLASPPMRPTQSALMSPDGMAKLSSTATIDSTMRMTGASPPASPTHGKQQSSHITLMKSMTMTRNRGFSFSTDESGGMRSVLMCETGSRNQLGYAGGSPAVLAMQRPRPQPTRKGHARHHSTASDWALYRGTTSPGPESAPPASNSSYRRKFNAQLPPLVAAEMESASSADSGDAAAVGLRTRVPLAGGSSSGSASGGAVSMSPRGLRGAGRLSPEEGTLVSGKKIKMRHKGKSKSTDLRHLGPDMLMLKQYGLEQDHATGRVIGAVAPPNSASMTGAATAVVGMSAGSPTVRGVPLLATPPPGRGSPTKQDPSDVSAQPGTPLGSSKADAAGVGSSGSLTQSGSPVRGKGRGHRRQASRLRNEITEEEHNETQTAPPSAAADQRDAPPEVQVTVIPATPRTQSNAVSPANGPSPNGSLGRRSPPSRAWEAENGS
ncbi:phospholipid-translocating P-type ATPase, flippase [Allomyces macrogynus ATCC 38327]|uniref:P-type phospholipid transporter n=1 Tax=Allomyces macrogynus (strain ATCC 38327) TaxID=578462 RepID=A0A0L0SSA0_ALLM3|nr:phospholipid-translocating P-type ATPase, flippase [Allomyces macrogynus ATCC 38327]|eukprot:KNE65371.1 phospholipid-translocating P-type ATPase, flippase [Allomyces macrogynus ATCC 38327]